MSQANKLLNLRVPDYILISVVTLSISLFIWQRYGMNYHSIINPVANQPYLFNDNDYGGTSQSELTSTRDTIRFSCDTQRSDLTFPFCSVYIPLVPEESEQGLDLSKYNDINIHLVFEGNLKDTVLVYVQNDEIDLNSMAMRRANMAILTTSTGPDDYQTAAKLFIVIGNSALWVGVIATFIGWVSMGANIRADDFVNAFGPAFAVSILTFMYGAFIKVLCYVAEQKIMFKMAQAG